MTAREAITGGGDPDHVAMVMGLVEVKLGVDAFESITTEYRP
jgi:hypothetical protein